jgi:trimeric autotransporter adhesin
VAALPADQLANASIASITVTSPAPGGGVSSGAKLTVNNPVPVVNSITPASLVAGAAAQTIDLMGTGFVPLSAVEWNGSALQTSFVSGTEIKATIPVQDAAAGQIAQISIANPGPGGGTSANASFNVNSPTPAVTGLSPKTAPANVAVVITITGTGFEMNSVAEWNGSPRPTTFVLPTSLQVALSAGDVQSPGTGQIVVNNPGPGGSAAVSVPLAILGPAPVITTVTPPKVLAGTSPLQITIQGSNFAANATVSVNSQALTIVSETATSIVATIPQTSLMVGGVLAVVVTNPGANPVQSNAYDFPVIAVPTIDSIMPASAAIGSPDLTITLSDSGLQPDSVVEWNGIPLATQPVTSMPFGLGTPILTGLTAVLPAADLSMFTTGSITVVSPEIAGAVSAPLAFST